MAKADMLLADDERNVREAFAAALESEGYTVRTAKNGDEALAQFAQRVPDLVILDVMMPKKDGFAVAMEIRRRNPAVPLMFLTAKSTEADKVFGLGLGADDYVVKTCGLAEFLARVRAALRRGAMAGNVAEPKSRFSVAGCTVDMRRLTVTRPDGAELAITMREARLLQVLAERPGEVVTRDELLNEVWGVNYSKTTRTLDQHVAQIRLKLGKKAAAAIETIRGTGYRYAN